MSLTKNQQGQRWSFKVSNVAKLNSRKNSRATEAIRLDDFVPNVQIRGGTYHGGTNPGIGFGEEQKPDSNLG